MHPPVEVAAAYQAVVSAELGKVTAIVEAHAQRNRDRPGGGGRRRGQRQRPPRGGGAAALAQAAGEAWSFRTLEAQYHAAPEEYRFRRRLETLEKRPRRARASRSSMPASCGMAVELWLTP